MNYREDMCLWSVEYKYSTVISQFSLVSIYEGISYKSRYMETENSESDDL